MKTKEQHEAAIVKVIAKHDIKRIAHIFRYYTDISRSRFYELGLDKSDSIKNALAYNREAKCADVINEMLASDNPTLKLAGYKLICPDEDREKLATTVKATATVAQQRTLEQTYDD